MVFGYVYYFSESTFEIGQLHSAFGAGHDHSLKYFLEFINAAFQARGGDRVYLWGIGCRAFDRAGLFN